MIFSKKNITLCITMIILSLSIFRGFIVLLIDNMNYTNIIYVSTTSFILLLSIYSFIYSFRNKNIDNKYSNLLIYNLILYLLYVTVELLINFKIDISVFNYVFVPYLVYLLIEIKDKMLNLLIILATISYSIFTFYDFYISNFLLNKDISTYYQQLLRPSTYETFSMTGEFVRPGGILGSAHDSGNVFGITTVFFLCRFILEKKFSIFYFFLFFVSILCLIISQSATNILSCLFILLIVFIFFITKYPIKLIYAMLFGLTISIILLFFINSYIPFDNLNEILSIWTNRTSSEGDWQGMLNGFQIFRFADFIHLIFGHASITNSNLVNSEVSFIKILFDIGIFGFIFFFLVIIYPLNFHKKTINFKKIYPSYFAILFCITSLIHYGSIFRMPNILFLIILNTLIFKEIKESHRVNNG
jgi:hypothetical protein